MRVRSVVIGMLCAALLSVPPAHSTAKKGPAKADHGALAFHRGSASSGFAVDQRSARAAQVEALKQCGHARCEIVARLRNGCGAVANGPRRFTVGIGATRQEAETKALRTCGDACEVALWACTR